MMQSREIKKSRLKRYVVHLWIKHSTMAILWI